MTEDDKIVPIAHPNGDTEISLEAGGEFDGTRVWLIVDSESLDRIMFRNCSRCLLQKHGIRANHTIRGAEPVSTCYHTVWSLDAIH